MIRHVLIILLVGVVFASGCISQNTGMENESMKKEAGNDSMIKPETTKNESDAMMEKDGSMMKYSGAVLAGTKSKLLDFRKADYDAAPAGKLVVLYFYADWCPICRAEIPRLYAAFDELDNENVIGFRVNFNDGSTDADERALARQYGVAYQHTKVFVKNGQQVLKSPETWEKQRYLAEINKAAA